MPNQAQDNIPLYATQGGGYATFKAGTLVWHELPDWMSELLDGDPDKQKIGDPIPEEWDFQPINESAREELFDEDYPIGFSDFLEPAGF